MAEPCLGQYLRTFLPPDLPRLQGCRVGGAIWPRPGELGGGQALCVSTAPSGPFVNRCSATRSLQHNLRGRHVYQWQETLTLSPPHVNPCIPKIGGGGTTTIWKSDGLKL